MPRLRKNAEARQNNRHCLSKPVKEERLSIGILTREFGGSIRGRELDAGDEVSADEDEVRCLDSGILAGVVLLIAGEGSREGSVAQRVCPITVQVGDMQNADDHLCVL